MFGLFGSRNTSSKPGPNPYLIGDDIGALGESEAESEEDAYEEVEEKTAYVEPARQGSRDESLGLSLDYPVSAQRSRGVDNNNNNNGKPQRSLFDMMESGDSMQTWRDNRREQQRKRPLEQPQQTRQQIDGKFDSLFNLEEGQDREVETEEASDEYDRGRMNQGLGPRKGPVPNSRKARKIVDPDNSLLGFLGILAAKLNRPFEEMVGESGLPTPEIQGMIEIARSSLIEWSGMRNIRLRDIVYDSGSGNNLRVKFAELIMALQQKQFGGAAYGKRISAKGGPVYYTSANHKLRNQNTMFLLGCKRYFENLYWAENPRLRDLITERSFVERRAERENGMKAEAERLAELEGSIEALRQAMPKVLIYSAV